MGTTTSRFGTLEERFWIKVGENLYLRPDKGGRECRACRHAAVARFHARAKVEGE
jgi:hypothetical protein